MVDPYTWAFPVSRIPPLPVAEPELAEAVMDRLWRIADGLAATHAEAAHDDGGGSPWMSSPHRESFTIVIPMLEWLLEPELRRGGTREGRAAMLAELVALLARPSLPEATCLQIAFGREVGEGELRMWDAIAQRADDRGLSIDECVAELVADDAVLDHESSRLFRGLSSRRPDAARIRRGIALLRTAASLVPPSMRPPMLCAIAWLEWARGRRDVAAAYAAEAADIEPDHVLAYSLGVMTTAWPLPAWVSTRARRRDRASVRRRW